MTTILSTSLNHDILSVDSCNGGKRRIKSSQLSRSPRRQHANDLMILRPLQGDQAVPPIASRFHSRLAPALDGIGSP